VILNGECKLLNQIAKNYSNCKSEKKFQDKKGFCCWGDGWRRFCLAPLANIHHATVLGAITPKNREINFMILFDKQTLK
jgi:hypothetical protein